MGTVGVGTVTRAPDLESYEEGTSVTLTATETTGWIFTGWSGDASGTTNPLTVTVNEDMSIIAEFEPEPEPEPETFTVTTGTSGEGTVSRDPDLESYEEGSEVTLTASPAEGWVFTGWSGDESGSDLTLTVTVTGDLSITAQLDRKRTRLNSSHVAIAYAGFCLTTQTL